MAFSKQKGVAVLGSTGSIGCNTLKVIDEFSSDFRVVALGAGRNMRKLAEQIERYRPALVSIETEGCREELERELQARGVNARPRVMEGEVGLTEVAAHEEADCVVSATVGTIGLVPTLSALERGKRVALANKETLVMAGEIVTRTAERNGAEILPVDSEHNALHQCLRGEAKSEVRRLVLTASGGPFRASSREEMERATVSEAMRHPTWEMGAKVTIDSATLVNKGLELIEAYWLFGFSPEKISIVIHPESIVHSLIELVDGSWIAQMGVTDMRHAIQYALTYPVRRPCALPPLDLTRLSALHFEEPDTLRFPAVRLAYQALSTGGTLPCALNAANEEAVKAFLDDRIRLTDIPLVIERVMDAHKTRAADKLEIILEADRAARYDAKREIAQLSEVKPRLKTNEQFDAAQASRVNSQ